MEEGAREWKGGGRKKKQKKEDKNEGRNEKAKQTQRC